MLFYDGGRCLPRAGREEHAPPAPPRAASQHRPAALPRVDLSPSLCSVVARARCSVVARARCRFVVQWHALSRGCKLAGIARGLCFSLCLIIFSTTAKGKSANRNNWQLQRLRVIVVHRYAARFTAADASELTARPLPRASWREKTKLPAIRQRESAAEGDGGAAKGIPLCSRSR
jgi:hypothetical protein